MMRISVVTPSYNQARFIERTLESVAMQRGPFEVEHIVVDGGSTDGTLSILERHAGRLRFVSEPDDGQSDAINKGLRMATGDVLAWLNSDDVYLGDALSSVASVLRGGTRWCFGKCLILDEEGRPTRRAVAWYKNGLSRRPSVPRLLSSNFIPQPAVFFRRELFDEVGPLDAVLHRAMDYDLWLRFARVARPLFVPRYLAGFRWHESSKSAAHYREGAWEAFQIACRHAREGERSALVWHLLHYASMTTVYGALDRLFANEP